MNPGQQSPIGGEFSTEPVRGLPDFLPPGEQMLWQGSPDWQSMALRAFHVREVAIYFGAMLTWKVASGVSDGQSIAAAFGGAAHLLPLAMAATGTLVLLAWLSSRAAVYTITSRRVVMRIGIALPMTLNIPFSKIEAASLRLFRDGAGDIPLRITPADRIAFLILWPHCRPWRIGRPEPMLRSCAGAAAVARTLSQALAAASGTTAVAVPPQPQAQLETPHPLGSPAAAA